MTDKEFVISIYEDAKYVHWPWDPRPPRPWKGRGQQSGIQITNNKKIRDFGWCINKSEEQTWYYARRDIEFEMLRKLES